MSDRKQFIAGSAAFAALGARPAAAADKLEKPNLRFGIAVDSPFYLPSYLAQARTWAPEGLKVELFAFRGDAEVSQALAGDSIDLMVASITGLISMIAAQQPVMGFYAGLNYAGFSWLARPEIKRWQDLKGKTMGISTFGSLNDSLTRYALQRHGLAPERDVNMRQAGNSAACYQALLAGRLDATILSAPYSWNAQSNGMTILGKQTGEVSPVWPAQCFSAKRAFIAANPNTILAVLRAHVAAVRLAHADRAFAAGVLQDRLKLMPGDAVRSIDENLQWYDERGRLPERYMNVFWKIESDAGVVKAAWPPSRYLDTKYIDTFTSWAPGGSARP